MKKLLSLLLCVAMMSALLTGCGGASSEDLAYTIGAGSYNRYEEIVKGETTSAVDGALTSNSAVNSTGGQDRKLIKTVNISAESQDYTNVVTSLDQKIAELGGYVESREQYNGSRRSCYVIIRIPADVLDLLVEHVETNANITSSTESAVDVTLEYVDTEAKVKSLETEQARLMELLAEAKNLSEILEIQSRMSDVTYELERYASRLRSLENQVSYATVNLSLREVEILTPKETPSIWERIGSGFTRNLESLVEDLGDIFVWVIATSPYLLVWAIIGTCVFFVARKVKKPVKKAPRPTPPTENQT